MSTSSKSASQPVEIAQLGTEHGERLRAIRLRGLREDPDAFCTTWEEAEAMPPESWRSQLEDLATFVATRDGRDLGMVRGAPHDEFADASYLISMWVAPEARKEGIGSLLIDAVVEWARARGSRQLFLDVAETNSPARALYEHRGFVANGELGSLPPPRESICEVQLVLTL